MEYTYDYVLANATPVGNGWSSLVILLASGDQAYVPGSDKYRAFGPGEVRYMLHPSGEEFTREPRVQVRKVK